MYRKLVVILAVVAVPCFAGVDEHKQRMIKENKTPKLAQPVNGACDECKLLVTRLDEALKDPTKMAELKNLLTLLCCQAKQYETACKLVVSRLDMIAHELEPFLRNPEEVCTKFHMCGNARLERLHRLSLVYARKYMNRIDGVNDVLCEECEFAVQELKTLLEEKEIQQEIQEFLHNYVCRYLGQYRGDCDELIEQFLPEFFEELENLLQNSKQVCTDLGLCSGSVSLSSVLVRGQPLFPADYTFTGNGVNHERLRENRNLNRWNSFTRLLTRLQTHQGIYMTCFECKLAVDAVLAGLEDDDIQTSIANDLQQVVCSRLPTEFTASCNDFLGTYLKTVVKMTVDHQSAQKLCTMLHVCTVRTFQDVVRVKASDKTSVACESCKGITDFLQNELGDPTLVSDITNGIDIYVCHNLPHQVQNLCENLAQTYVPSMISKLQTMLNSEAICKDDLHMCTDELLQTINL